MRVQALSLTDYRNYASLFLRTPGMINVFIGQNAQGKTNLLETLYLLATGRSVRAGRDAEMIRWGQSHARVVADIERLYGTVRLEINLQAGTAKRIRVNDNPIKRVADLFGYLNVVAFTPDDLQLVKGSPSHRRQFLDYEIAQVSKSYRDHLGRYNRVLRQRNSILKDMAQRLKKSADLQAWEPQFIYHGVRVIVHRAGMMQALSPLAADIHRQITGGKETLQLLYEPFFLGENETAADDHWHDAVKVTDRFEREIHRLRTAERQRGTSLVGPQRDDVAFVINGMDARTYGSQGQQRTAVLACKLAEIAYMEHHTGEPPVLLLDDVMSELDAGRRAFLIDVVQDRVQTFITAANEADLGDTLLQQADLYHIREGTVTTDD